MTPSFLQVSGGLVAVIGGALLAFFAIISVVIMLGSPISWTSRHMNIHDSYYIVCAGWTRLIVLLPVVASVVIIVSGMALRKTGRDFMKAIQEIESDTRHL